MKRRNYIVIIFSGIIFTNCNKGADPSPPPPPPPPASFALNQWAVNGNTTVGTHYNVSRTPVIRLSFGAAINRTTTSMGILFKESSGTPVNFNITYQNSDSILLLSPVQPLSFLTKYVVTIGPPLKSAPGGSISSTTTINFLTTIDSTRKFPQITDDSLLSLVQKQTFKYFWDFGHPVSGLARERNTSGETVTSGGSGFGIMAIITGVHRNFISRNEGLARLQQIVGFLKNKAERFHGAYPHWLN